MRKRLPFARPVPTYALIRQNNPVRTDRLSVIDDGPDRGHDAADYRENRAADSSNGRTIQAESVDRRRKYRNSTHPSCSPSGLSPSYRNRPISRHHIQYPSRHLHEYGSLRITQEKRNKLLATVARNNTVRANRTLTVSEMNALLLQMEITEPTYQYNHGRPTWTQLTLSGQDAISMREQ